MLTQQGYAPDDILPEGKRSISAVTPTFLRVVTPIDVTETIDSSYQELAAAMATSMGPGLAGLTSSFQIKLSLLARKNLISLVSSSTSIPLCIFTPIVLKVLDKLSLQNSRQAFSRSCHKSNLKPNS